MNKLNAHYSRFAGVFCLSLFLFSFFDAQAENLSQSQIKQIEEIAKSIAKESNTNKQNYLDEMTESFIAEVAGRNVRFEYTLRVKKNLSSSQLKPWLTETKNEIIPRSCRHNSSNPAFDRGLSYTFLYKSIHGQNLGEFTVDKSICRNLGL